MIDEKDIDFLYKIGDNRYRKVDDCNDIMEKNDRRSDQLEKAFTASNTKLNVLIAILSFIASALIPICLEILLGG